MLDDTDSNPMLFGLSRLQKLSERSISVTRSVALFRNPTRGNVLAHRKMDLLKTEEDRTTFEHMNR